MSRSFRLKVFSKVGLSTKRQASLWETRCSCWQLLLLLAGGEVATILMAWKNNSHSTCSRHKACEPSRPPPFKACTALQLALANVLISPLNMLPVCINGLVEALVSVRRVQRFMVAPEVRPSACTRIAASPSLLMITRRQQDLYAL